MAKTGVQWNFQDKNQRVSRVNSEFLRNSISQHMCQDGSVNLPSQEVDAIIRNLSRKEKKISKMWWALGFAAIFSVALFALTFASALSANEASKESHVNDGTLEDLDGNTVSVQEIETFATLFDLPRFDTSTLDKVSKITLSVADDKEMSFTITDVINDMGCGTATFISSSGASVIIDSTTGIALVKVPGDKTYIVKSGSLENSNRALYESNEAAPRLLSRAAFFTQDRGFASSSRLGGNVRRMANDDSISGWASLSLAAAAAVLGNTEHSDIEYSSVYIAGNIVGEDAGPYEALYINETHSKVKRTNAVTGASDIAMWIGDGFEMHYNGDGSLDFCNSEAISQDPFDKIVLESRDLMVSQCAKIVKFSDESVFEVEHMDLGATFFEYIETPSPQECVDAIRARQAAESIAAYGPASDNHEGRKLSGAVDAKTMQKLAAAAYDGASPPYGWIQGSVCSAGYESWLGGDRRAIEFKQVQYTNNCVRWNQRCSGALWWRKCSNYCAEYGHIETGVKTLAFEGTNKGQLNDWITDLDNGGGQGAYHPGFDDYQQKIVDECPWVLQRTFNYITGHSLGGAAATMFKEKHGRPGKVVTFGAPKTHLAGTACPNDGSVRFWHADDPITGNPSVFGLHDVFHNRVHHNDNSFRVYGGHSASGCDSGCSWTSNGWYSAATIWHFATTHNEYDSHIGFNMNL